MTGYGVAPKVIDAMRAAFDQPATVKSAYQVRPAFTVRHPAPINAQVAPRA